MLLLFSKNILLSSKLSEEEIKSRVENCITTNSNSQSEQTENKKISIIYYSKPYEGKLIGNTFKMIRIERLNLFRKRNPPVILGVITPLKNETQIQIKIRLSRSSFFTLFSFLIIYVYFIFYNLKIEANLINLQFLIPLAFIYLVVLLNFVLETSESIKFLKHIFDTEIIKN